MNIILKYCTAIVIIALALSNSADPPNGRTGAPGDGVCSSCHQGNNFEGNVQVDGLPSEVESGKTYSLSVSVNNTDGKAIRAGFQMVSLFNGEFDNAGEYITSSNDVGVTEASSRLYVEHRGAKNFQDSVSQWIFDWEAPTVEEEKEVIMFAVGNITNGSGSSGDAVKFSEVAFVVKPAVMDTLKAEIEVIDIVCSGEPGDLEVIANGGVEPYSYLWSNGIETAENFDVLAGFYSVTVTDGNDSTAVAEVILDEPENISFELMLMNETSAGASDGSIETTVTGGTEPYTYLWSNGETTANLEGISAGMYTLTVTDANGCTDMISATIDAAPCSFELNLDFNQITCAGEEDGEAFIDPADFEQPLTFEWSNGDNTFIAIAGLAPGEYAITATDGSGCTIVESFTIVDPAPLNIDASVNIEDCENPSINTVSADITGGTGSYTYLWSNASTESVITNAPEGAYSVTVTDENGCEAVQNDIIVSFTDEEFPEISFTDSVTLFVDASGEIDFTPLNLSETDNCGIESVELSGDLSCDNLEARTITYEVTDLSGNIASVDIFITGIIDTVPPTANCIADIIQDGCDTIFYDLPEFMDNCGIDSIELAEGLPSGSVFPKDSTKVTYNAYDKAGNFFCCSFWVVTTNDLELVVDEVVDATPENGGGISISVSGGSGMFNYEWTLNDTLVVSSFEDVTNLVVGSYKVKVTDENGCTILSDAILVEMGSSAQEYEVVKTKLFPNPSEDFVFVDFEAKLINAQVINIDGKTMEAVSVQNMDRGLRMNITPLVSGVYFLKLEFPEGSKSLRFVKL